MSLYFCFNPLHPNCARKCYCGPRCLHCLCPRISVSGVVPRVAGRPRPGARGLVSGPRVSLPRPGPGCHPPLPGHSPPALASCEETADWTASETVQWPVMGWHMRPANMMQCTTVKKLLLLFFLSSVASGIEWTHWSKWREYPSSDDASLIVHYGCLSWHDNCFNVLFRTWQEENTVAFIWLHFAGPEGWKAQGLRWVFVKLPKKDWISEILNGQQAWL